MSISNICEHIINEITYNRFKTKQKSIGKLFPEFEPRVKAVLSNGSIEMRTMMPEHWHFSVASGTKKGVKYDVYVQFNDIPEMIKRFAGDKSLWKKDQSGPNYNLLAAEILNKVDMKLSCSCPADLYWGGAYIKTQRDSQFGRQEHRPPNIRNPRQYGAYCKHTELVMRLLTGWTTTFASFLKKYWSDEVDDAVELMTQQRDELGAVADELGQMAAEPGSGRFTRGGEEIPPEEGEEGDGEGEEPPTPPDEDEPPPNIDPSSATKPGTTLPAKGTQPGLKRLGIEPEERPKLKDKDRKGKYKADESVNEDSMKSRLGKCYVLSGRYVMDNPEWDLVHGTITQQNGSGKTIKHAWAEKVETVDRYKIRWVFDPVWGNKMPWDAYVKFVGAEEEKRYTSGEMIEIILKQKNWGPWDE